MIQKHIYEAPEDVGRVKSKCSRRNSAESEIFLLYYQLCQLPVFLNVSKSSIVWIISKIETFLDFQCVGLKEMDGLSQNLTSPC